MGKKTNGLKEQEELNVPVLNTTNVESTPEQVTPEEFEMSDRSKTYTWRMAQLKKQGGE